MGLEPVPFIKFYPGFDQQVPLLLLGRGLSVRLFLSLDGFDPVVDVALGAGKRGVPLLPARKPLEHRVRFDPEHRACLDVLHEIRQADAGRQAAENVKVILHAINAVKMALAVLDDAPKVAEKVFAAVSPENRPPAFGRKDDVVGDNGMG